MVAQQLLTRWTAICDSLRRGARVVRYAADRLWHRQRQRVAGRRLERLRPRSVLVVCHGNLCRSPYAEHRLRALLPGGPRRNVTIASAGFLAAGHVPPANAVLAAAGLGIDLTGHRSRQLSAELIRGADLVLVMEPEQRHAILSVHRRSAATIMLLGDFDPEPISTRAIPDPYGRSVEAFVAVYRRIDRCVAVAARALGAAPWRRTPRPTEVSTGAVEGQPVYRGGWAGRFGESNAAAPEPQ